MDIIVYRIGEMVSTIGATLICLILIWGCYWIFRTKLNPHKITKADLQKAMTEAYKDVVDDHTEWDYPALESMHDAMISGEVDPLYVNCIIHQLCDSIDEYNHRSIGRTYDMWMTSLIRHIQV